MTVTIITTLSGHFEEVFLNEEDARKWVLRQPGRFNNYDIIVKKVRTHDAE